MKKIFIFCLLAVFVAGLTGGSFAATKKAKPKPKKAAVTPAAQIPTAKPVVPAVPVKAGLFVEGGLAGGAGAVEFGYGRGLNDKLMLSGAAGYAVGNGFGVVILDLLRATYDLGTFFGGGGLSYAMYSNANVTSVPGLSGKISSQNLLGVDVFAGKRINDKLSAKVGYSTALGLRAGLGYEF